MTTLTQVRRRAPWGDARFIIGILLVAASVAGVWFVVTGARQTAPVLVADRTIVPGDAVTSADVRVVEAVLGAGGDVYLAEELPAGMVATRVIAAGEFVPAAALEDADATRTTTVVVRSAIAVPAAVARGTTVDVWAAPALERGQYGTPAILVADAVVAAVGEDEGMIADRSVTLELVIERSAIARTLEAVAAQSALSVVPTTGGR